MSRMGHIGHYQLVRELGSGTYAIVYQAWDGYLRRDVAIKMLCQGVVLKALAKNPEERFKDIFDFALELNRGINKSRTGR